MWLRPLWVRGQWQCCYGSFLSISHYYDISICFRYCIDDEDEGCSLTKTARIFKDCLISTSIPLSHEVSLHVSTYITQTLPHHFNLYYYLVNHQQQESLTNLDMFVYTAEKDIPPLQSGIELSEWEKKEKVREMEEMNSLKERDMQKLREISITEEKKEIDLHFIQNVLVDSLRKKSRQWLPCLLRHVQNTFCHH